MTNHECADELLRRLQQLAQPDQLAGMARFGMSTRSRLGIGIPVLRRMAKECGKNQAAALRLWESGLEEARILASMIAEPKYCDARLMEAWVVDFDSWDVCDQVCMNLFEKLPFAVEKIHQWSTREEEFVKRAAFALLACLAWHDKKAADSFFLAFFPLIRQASDDPRNFVKKAVSWALRTIGKRNRILAIAALEEARAIQEGGSKAARWIGSDVSRELTKKISEDVKA